MTVRALERERTCSSKAAAGRSDLAESVICMFFRGPMLHNIRYAGIQIPQMRCAAAEGLRNGRNQMAERHQTCTRFRMTHTGFTCAARKWVMFCVVSGCVEWTQSSKFDRVPQRRSSTMKLNDLHLQATFLRVVLQGTKNYLRL